MEARIVHVMQCTRNAMHAALAEHACLTSCMHRYLIQHDSERDRIRLTHRMTASLVNVLCMATGAQPRRRPEPHSLIVKIVYDCVIVLGCEWRGWEWRQQVIPCSQPGLTTFVRLTTFSFSLSLDRSPHTPGIFGRYGRSFDNWMRVCLFRRVVE